MEPEEVVRYAEAFARPELSDGSSGHDWSLNDRVTRLARRIAREEGADVFLCALAALLHDIADYKIAGDEAAGQRRVREWLAGHRAPTGNPAHVQGVIPKPPFVGRHLAPERIPYGSLGDDAAR